MLQHRILLVEDLPEDREATIRVLKKAGTASPIDYCETGDEALDYLFQRGKYTDSVLALRPSVVSLDLNLPGTDGREVLAEMKKADHLMAIRVVILTTSTDDHDIQACYRMGANSYVTKAVDLDGFMKSIRRLCDYWFEVVSLPKPK